MKKTIGVLILTILTATIIITMQELRIEVKSTSTIFRDTSTITGIEYNKIFSGNKQVRVIFKKITHSTINNTVEIIRTTDRIRDTYTFDSESTNKENFPVHHKIEVFNSSGLTYQYEVTNLDYSGETSDINGTSMNFGKNMKVTWSSGYYFAKVYSSGRLVVKYRITSDYMVFYNRLFDPTNPVNFISPVNNSVISGTVTVNMTTTGTDEHFSFIDLDGSLIFWMRMDHFNSSTYFDNSSYRNHGTINGINRVIVNQSKFGKGLQYSTNSKSNITIPHQDYMNANISRNNVSISFWYNVSSSDVTGYVFQKWDGTIGYYALSSFITILTEHYISIGISDGVFEDTVNVNLTKYTNTWQHIVGIINDNISIYMNGTLMSTTPLTIPTRDASNAINATIGYSDIDGINSFRGQLDEFMIFNRSLSQAEISSLYNASKNQYYNNFQGLLDGNHIITGYTADVDGDENMSQINFNISSSGCTPPVSGNWNIDCAQNCSWTNNITISGNVTLTGNGTANLSALWNFTGTNQYVFIYQSCELNIYKNGGFA